MNKEEFSIYLQAVKQILAAFPFCYFVNQNAPREKERAEWFVLIVLLLSCGSKYSMSLTRGA